jgi:6-phosphogluconolactonase
MTRRLIFRLFVLTVAMLAALPLIADTPGAEQASSKSKYFVYVGTYTEHDSKGIYAYRYDAATGQLDALGLVAESTNPSFLALHPQRPFLYAVNETGNYEGKKSGAVSAFAIDRSTGKLTLLNQVASRGADPCYLSFDRTGKHLLVANYTGGNVAVFPIQHDGHLAEASSFVQHTGSSVNHERQEGPHAHSIDLSSDNRFAVAADLGTDRLVVYRFDKSQGALAANDPPFIKIEPGSGPRHFTFHPGGKFAYLVNELRSTVTVLSYEPAGGILHELQTISTLPNGFAGENDVAEVQVHPTGKFLYASNRGRDSIAVFRIDAAQGTLTSVEDVPSGGKTPRYFTIDPSGSRLFVANQDSDNIVIFRIDPRTGRLTSTGEVLKAPSPVCVRFYQIK